MDLYFYFYFLVVTPPPPPPHMITSVTVERIRILTCCVDRALHTVASRSSREGGGGLDRQKQKQRPVASGLKVALKSDKTTWVSSAAEVKDVAANPCAPQTVGVESPVCIQCINGNVDKHCPLQPHNCVDC